MRLDALEWRRPSSQGTFYIGLSVAVEVVHERGLTGKRSRS